MGGVCPCLGGDAPPQQKKLPAASSSELKQPLIEPTTKAPAPAAKPPAPAAPAAATPAPAPVPQKMTAPDEPRAADSAKSVTSNTATTGGSFPQEVVEDVPSKSSLDQPGGDGGNDQPSGDGLAAVMGEVGHGTCVEVYSNSYSAWCPGVIFGLDAQSLLVAYQVPGEAVEANISTKTLPFDSPEIRLPTETGCWLTAAVEVYSHSNKAWCVGKVTENNGGVLSVVFFYPNEPPDAVPVMKQLELGNKDLRLRGVDAAFSIGQGAGQGHETLQVNSPVEVYSNSLGVWCPGIVKELNEGCATVAFYYPDMDPNTETPAVKELPLGHQDLRLPGFATGQPYNTGPAVTEADLKLEMQIEVFSASRQVWITSTVKKIENGEVTVQLRYPDMPPDSDLYEKVLQIGANDMRLIPENKE